MQLKSIILTVLAAFGIGQKMQAQNLFDEMIYNVKQTVFNLNSPTGPYSSGDAVDGVTGATPLSEGEGKGERSVYIRIYNDGIGGKAIKTVRMKKNGENRWTATVKGNLKGKFYTFDAGYGETPGVFAKAVGVNGKRGAIIQNSNDVNELVAPEGWNKDTQLPLKSPADLVIYEMHHRDFSIAEPNAKYPGKFLALTEPWAIDHLKKLGVNAVHILPSFDFGSVDETKLDKPQYNWGYDPVNYNVPEGSYSTDPYNPATRIIEFKKMVQALHKAGIRVILDVVYNHTYDLKNSNFQKTFPNAYYRFTKDGKPSNGSGCGNETASEKPLMHEFMLESVKYWINEYHIDGFRFDLMGVHDIQTMNDIRAEVNKINPNIFIYGEGWSAGSCAYPNEKLAMKANIKQMPGIAAFCDDMRDALRGPFSDDHKGAFLVGLPGSEESIKAGIAGMIAHPQVDYSKVNYSKEPWATEPTQCISYVSCHDDMCLVDRLKAEGITGLTPSPSPTERGDAKTDISNNELIRLDELAQTAVFTSQGVPFMLSGEEMLRDKKGVHNSFESPDSINELPWANMQKYPQVFDYYSKLISLRHNHPAFRLGNADLVRKHLEFLPTQDCLVGYILKDNAGGDAWKNIIVILNSNKEAKDVTIPEGKYTVVCCDGKIDEDGLDTVDGSHVVVDGQSALILHD